jgi:xanthine dehydrogenase small subunit
MGAYRGGSKLFADHGFGIVRSDFPALIEIIRLIASKQIRNFGTLAGNVANASPSGILCLCCWSMKPACCWNLLKDRDSLPEDFFLGFRKTALMNGEYIREIIMPVPPRSAFVRVMKSAKRKSVDISSVASAIRIEKDEAGISKAILAFGGVAATPVISSMFPILMQKNDPELTQKVADEFQPLSDVRGSAEYRRQMIINHILAYLEAYHG